jgi:hypothetical protein
MAAILFPFTALLFLAEWQREIQIGAACLVIALGLYLLINRRHPRFLARVPPSRLALWSFLAAMAHGAGLMLVPIYLGICRTVETDAGPRGGRRPDGGQCTHRRERRAGAHACDDALGRGLAWGVYRWLGLRFLSRSWFNLDLVWALSLILVGAISLAFVH